MDQRRQAVSLYGGSLRIRVGSSMMYRASGFIKTLNIPSSKLTQTLADRGWKTSFHYFFWWFSGSMLIYQRVSDIISSRCLDIQYHQQIPYYIQYLIDIISYPIDIQYDIISYPTSSNRFSPKIVLKQCHPSKNKYRPTPWTPMWDSIPNVSFFANGLLITLRERGWNKSLGSDDLSGPTFHQDWRF